ncbi:MAG: DUF1345 domain-containing protein, partial [Mycobacterium sp.]
APPVGWIVAGTVFLAWTWVLLWPMEGAETRQHANDWDSRGRTVHGFVLIAGLASLAGVGYLLSGKTQHDFAAAAVGVLSVAASWFTIHTFFMLHYARLYYGAATPPIDFNDDDPQPSYHDFAYLAFTVGMTYQVSDTELRTTQLRRAVLSQALLSFVMGAIIIAITLNLVVALAGP